MGAAGEALWLLGTTGPKPDPQTFHPGLSSAATWAGVPGCAHAVQQQLAVTGSAQWYQL